MFDLAFKSGIAQGGGLNQNYRNSSEQYSVGFSLALRMISLASGVTVGLFVSQVLGKKAHSCVDYSPNLYLLEMQFTCLAPERMEPILHFRVFY